MALSWLTAEFGQSTVNDGLTRWYGLGSRSTASSAEANCEIPVRVAGVASKLGIYVSSNAWINSSAWKLRKSQADSGIAITVAAGATGRFENTSDTASYAATDEIDLQVFTIDDIGTLGAILDGWSFAFAPTDASKCLTICASQPITSFSTASATRYLSCHGLGSTTAPAITESTVKSRAKAPFAWSNLYGYASANARTTTTTIKSRKNGADGNQSIAWTSGQTGAKEDTSNSDTLVDGDDYCYSFVTGSGSGAFDLQCTGSTLVSAAQTWKFGLQQQAALSISAGSTVYWPLGQSLNSTTTEANVTLLPRIDFEVFGLAAYAETNTLSGSCVVTYRDNGADSVLTVTWTTGQTGWKEDTTNAVAVTGGTDTAATKVAAAAGTGSIGLVGVHYLARTPISVAPDAASVASTAPAPTVSLSLSLAPDPATVAATAADPAVMVDISITPDPASAASSVPDPTIDLGSGTTLSPDSAEATQSAPSVSLSFGPITKHETSSPGPRMTAPEPSLAFGPVSLSPEPAGMASTGPASSVGHGEAVRSIGVVEALGGVPDVVALHGTAAFTPEAAVATFAPADLNVAIDYTLRINAVSSAISAGGADVSCGEAVLTPEPASVALVPQDTTATADLAVAPDPASMASAPDDPVVGQVFALAPDAVEIDITSRSASTVMEQIPEPAHVVFRFEVADPSVALGGLTLAPDPCSMASVALGAAGPYQIMSDTTAMVAYCLVAPACEADCLVAAIAGASCLVVPMETATTAKGQMPSTLPGQPEAV